MRRVLYSAQACWKLCLMCPFFVFQLAELAGLGELKIRIKSLQTDSANWKRPCSESLEIAYMLIIGIFLTSDLHMSILTTRLFFQIDISSTVFRDIFLRKCRVASSWDQECLRCITIICLILVHSHT